MSAIRPAPLALPVLPGVALSGRYVLGDPTGESRGDCLDAVAIPGGKVGLFVADVVGLDGPADLAAEHLRAILRERLASGAELSNAMETLNNYAERHPQLVAASVCVAILDTSDGSLEWTAAGHPPPLVWGPDASPTFLVAPSCRPLGTGGTATTQTGTLAEGELLALYTDGLVAFEGRPLADGSIRLADSAARSLTEGGSTIPAQLGDLVCDRMLRDVSSGDQHDDAAILLAMRTPRTQPMTLRMPSDPERLPGLRHSVNVWLDGLGVSLVDHVGLGHAVVELAANVIKHAYLTEGGGDPAAQVVLVEGHLDDEGWVHIVVTDHGQWREQESSGRGMMMAAGLVDRMEVHRTPDGTRVQISQRLNRPVAVLQPVSTKPGEQVLDEASELLLDFTEGGLVAAGPVDDFSTDMFHTALTRATHSGTRDSLIDLDRVSHLGSAGVQALFECLARSEDAGARMSLQASSTSPAAQILRLVDLPVSSPN